MEIKYKFVNGEETSISVYGDFEEIILELDRNLYNNNHAETRRHISLDAFDQNKNIFVDIEAGFEDRVLNQVDKEILYKAISKLKPDEQELIRRLYLSDCPVTQKGYAKKLSVSHITMRKRVERLKAKLARLVGADEQNCTKQLKK